jgi:hypothetical protein
MVAIACGGRQARSTCSTPGCGRPTVALCDYEVVKKGKPGTCDAKLCDRCRQRQGEDRDFCPPHAKLAARPNQVGAPGAAPAPGDRRVHVPTGRMLYVVSVARVDGHDFVTFSPRAPVKGERCGGVLQTVPLDKWLEKTREP